jgi:hypothetical protein
MLTITPLMQLYIDYNDCFIGGGVHPLTVPYDTLTDKEKKKYKDQATELLKFLQFQGFRISRFVY